MLSNDLCDPTCQNTQTGSRSQSHKKADWMLLGQYLPWLYAPRRELWADHKTEIKQLKINRNISKNHYRPQHMKNIKLKLIKKN